jgi:hypothetical protein
LPATRRKREPGRSVRVDAAPEWSKSNGSKQPGLDDRHRDKDGKISMKHGNT